MKVRLLTTVDDGVEVYAPGTEVDFSESDAQRLLDGGDAIEVVVEVQPEEIGDLEDNEDDEDEES